MEAYTDIVESQDTGNMPTKRKPRTGHGPGKPPKNQGYGSQNHQQQSQGNVRQDVITQSNALHEKGTQKNSSTQKDKKGHNTGQAQKGTAKETTQNGPKTSDPQNAISREDPQKGTFSWWLILCVIDILINCVTCGEINMGTDLDTLGLSAELFVTFQQLWWTSIFRLALLTHLYHVYTQYIHGLGSTQEEGLTSRLRYTCYAHICITPIFCCHLVARLLLDSETTQSDPIILSATSTTSGPAAIVANISSAYCGLLVWHVLCTVTQVCVSWRCLPTCPGGEGGTGEQRDKKGSLVAGGGQVGQATLYKLFVWYRPHLKLILLGYVFLIVHATVDAMLPYYKAKVIDVIKSEHPLEGLSQHVVGMVLLSLIGTLTTSLWSSVTIRIRSGLHFRIRARLFRWIVYQEMAFFDKTKSGELTASLASDAEALGGVLSRLDSVIKTATRIIGMIFFMARLSWQLTLVVVMGNTILVVTTHFYGKYTRNIHKKSQECRRAANVIAQEVVSSMRTVRAFGSEEEEVTRYTEKCREQYKLQLTEAWLSPSYTAVDQVLHMTLMASTIFYGGHLVVKERISSGDLVSFILYLTKLGSSMSSLLNVHQWLMRMLGASEKVFKYLDAEPVAPPDGTEAPDHLAGKIELTDVTFAYPTRPDVNVLKELSLSVAPGEVVALVGPSGAGKSSVFNLLQRFYPPVSGHVTLDSRPLAAYKHTYLRSKMAIVSQEPTLFARSIQENISYGLSPDDVTSDDVLCAARDANAASFIDRFPDGMETYVGEKGQQLSGGQKQRVAIARALIRDPTVLLLDEATSALDTESEKQVQEALHRTVGGRTVVIIAHRLSTVRRADRILVLNRGSIVEEGTHDHLLQKQGLYYNLVKCQLLRGIT